MIINETRASLSKDLAIMDGSPVQQNGLLLSLDEEHVHVMTQRQVQSIAFSLKGKFPQTIM